MGQKAMLHETGKKSFEITVHYIDNFKSFYASESSATVDEPCLEGIS